MKSLRSHISRAALALALVLPAAFVLAPGAALAAANPIRMTLFVGSPCFNGWATVGSTVSYKWRDAGGNLKQEGEVQASDPGGLWYSECTEDFSGPLIEPGDKFVVSDGHFTRRLTLPDLSIELNRVTDRIKGTAPAGSQVRIEYLFPAYPSFDIVTYRETVNVGSDGRWSFNVGNKGYDMVGGEGAGIVWRSDHADKVFMFANAPRVTVTIGRSRVSGEVDQYSSAHVELRDATTGDTKGAASITVGLNQAFSQTIRSGNGDAVSVSAGDHVVSDLATDANFIVPDIQFATDAATDTVTGKCFNAGRFTPRVHIYVYRTGIRRGFVATWASQDGTFQEKVGRRNAFPDPAVLKSGDRVLVECFLDTGDSVQKWGDVL